MNTLVEDVGYVTSEYCLPLKEPQLEKKGRTEGYVFKDLEEALLQLSS